MGAELKRPPVVSLREQSPAARLPDKQNGDVQATRDAVAQDTRLSERLRPLFSTAKLLALCGETGRKNVNDVFLPEGWTIAAATTTDKEMPRLRESIEREEYGLILPTYENPENGMRTVLFVSHRDNLGRLVGETNLTRLHIRALDDHAEPRLILLPDQRLIPCIPDLSIDSATFSSEERSLAFVSNTGDIISSPEATKSVDTTRTFPQDSLTAGSCKHAEQYKPVTPRSGPHTGFIIDISALACVETERSQALRAQLNVLAALGDHVTVIPFGASGKLFVLASAEGGVVNALEIASELNGQATSWIQPVTVVQARGDDFQMEDVPAEANIAESIYWRGHIKRDLANEINGQRGRDGAIGHIGVSDSKLPDYYLIGGFSPVVERLYVGGPPTFVDATESLEKVREAIENRKIRVLIIDGRGGDGKSALVEAAFAAAGQGDRLIRTKFLASEREQQAQGYGFIRVVRQIAQVLGARKHYAGNKPPAVQKLLDFDAQGRDEKIAQITGEDGRGLEAAKQTLLQALIVSWSSWALDDWQFADDTSIDALLDVAVRFKKATEETSRTFAGTFRTGKFDQTKLEKFKARIGTGAVYEKTVERFPFYVGAEITPEGKREDTYFYCISYVVELGIQHDNAELAGFKIDREHILEQAYDWPALFASIADNSPFRMNNIIRRMFHKGVFEIRNGVIVLKVDRKASVHTDINAVSLGDEGKFAAEQLAELPLDAKRILQAVAFAGGDLSPEILSGIIQQVLGMNTEQGIGLVNEVLIKQEYLIRDSAAGGTYNFGNDAMRDYILADTATNMKEKRKLCAALCKYLNGCPDFSKTNIFGILQHIARDEKDAPPAHDAFWTPYSQGFDLAMKELSELHARADIFRTALDVLGSPTIQEAVAQLSETPGGKGRQAISNGTVLHTAIKALRAVAQFGPSLGRVADTETYLAALTEIQKNHPDLCAKLTITAQGLQRDLFDLNVVKARTLEKSGEALVPMHESYRVLALDGVDTAAEEDLKTRICGLFEKDERDNAETLSLDIFIALTDSLQGDAVHAICAEQVGAAWPKESVLILEDTVRDWLHERLAKHVGVARAASMTMQLSFYSANWCAAKNPPDQDESAGWNARRKKTFADAKPHFTRDNRLEKPPDPDQLEAELLAGWLQLQDFTDRLCTVEGRRLDGDLYQDPAIFNLHHAHPGMMHERDELLREAHYFRDVLDKYPGQFSVEGGNLVLEMCARLEMLTGRFEEAQRDYHKALLDSERMHTDARSILISLDTAVSMRTVAQKEDNPARKRSRLHEARQILLQEALPIAAAAKQSTLTLLANVIELSGEMIGTHLPKPEQYDLVVKWSQSPAPVVRAKGEPQVAEWKRILEPLLVDTFRYIQRLIQERATAASPSGPVMFYVGEGLGAILPVARDLGIVIPPDIMRSPFVQQANVAKGKAFAESLYPYPDTKKRICRLDRLEKFADAA